MGERIASQKIVHNSLWYGLETALEIVVFLGSSILVARYLGPEQLGYYAAVSFPISVISATAGMGLANATRKYMSEFLGTGRAGLARAVYHFNYKYQFLSSVVLTVVGLAIVLGCMPPQHRLMSILLVLAIVPGMMSWVPAQANLAFEDASKNTISAFGYILAYAAIVVMAVKFRWGLPGIASAMLIGRTIEVFLRTVPLNRYLRTLPEDTLPLDVKTRIRRFWLQALSIQVLTCIVWDKSELFFLTAFCDIKQVAYYSISAGLIDKLLVGARVFASSTGVTLMAQSAREVAKIRGIVFNALRFLCLIVLPVHIGASIVAPQAITAVYGQRYLGAIPVIMIAAVLGIPRAFQDIPGDLIRACDKQDLILRSMLIAGAVNVVVDLLLVPRFGAIGAAIGNGIAQSFGVLLLWGATRRMYKLHFPISSALRVLASTLVVSAVAFAASRLLPLWIGLVAAIVLAVPTYVLMIRISRALDSDDRQRLDLVTERLPRSVRPLGKGLVRFVIPEQLQVPEYVNGSR
jgi:O-antigen/teichoic acid export membrane protein